MTDDAEDILIPQTDEVSQQQNLGADENKTETKRETAPKGHLSKEDWVALGRKEADWQSPDEYADRQGALKKSVANLERRLTEKERSLDRIEATTRKALQRIRDSQVADLQKRQYEATALADVETVARLRHEEAELQQQFYAEDRQAAGPGLLPETQSWMQSNPQFQRDPVWTEKALAAYNQAERLAPRASEAEKLNYVDRMMNSGVGGAAHAASAMPDVHGGTRQAAPVKKQTAAALPADAQRVGQKQVKMGLFKNMDEYAKAYYEDA